DSLQILQELLALPYRDRVGLDEFDLLKADSRQRQQMELDRQEYFANDREIIILQQGIIGQKTSRNGVFDRHHDVVCFFMLHFLEHPFEGHAFHGVDIFTEIGACRFVVEGSPYALYCYGRSFRHYFLQKKKSRATHSGLPVFLFKRTSSTTSPDGAY